MTNYTKTPTGWMAVTCPNCKRVIGYDDDSYKDIEALKCPSCHRWFYMADAKKEFVTVDVQDYGKYE
jgi:hypothetical protein